MGERRRDRGVETETETERERHLFWGSLEGQPLTYQFLPEPGYRFVDALEALQLASGRGPVVLAGHPIRWRVPPGCSRGERGLLLHAAPLPGHRPREGPRLLLQPGLPFQVGGPAGLQPQFLREGLQAPEVVVGRRGCSCRPFFPAGCVFYSDLGHRHARTCLGSQTWEVVEGTVGVLVGGKVGSCSGRVSSSWRRGSRGHR